jgi:hypothetical protein
MGVKVFWVVDAKMLIPTFITEMTFSVGVECILYCNGFCNKSDDAFLDLYFVTRCVQLVFKVWRPLWLRVQVRHKTMSERILPF